MKKTVLLLLMVSVSIFAQAQETNEQPTQGAFKEVTDVKTKTKERVITLSEGELFAQPTDQGYQLMSGDSKIVYELLKVNVQDLYVIKDKNGVIYKNEDKWFVEFYKEGKKVKEEYKLKF